MKRNPLLLPATLPMLRAGVAFLLLFFAAMLPAKSRIIYVGPDQGTGLQDGTSWATAYFSLNAALQAITSPTDTVVVARGRYIPSFSNARGQSFEFRQGVILGGWAGTETHFGQAALDARDLVANATLLSGDLRNNDLADSYTNHVDNSYHVARAETQPGQPLVVDGFTIQSGYDNLRIGNAKDGGAGLKISQVQAPMHFRHLLLRNNFALAPDPDDGGGGGAINIQATPTGADTVYFEHLEAYGNQSLAAGGALFLEGAGAIVSLRHSVIHDNMAPQGGGLYLGAGAVALLENAVVQHNTATIGSGGGLHVKDAGHITLTRVALLGNEAQRGGGAYYGQATATMVNVTIAGNSAQTDGGGIYYPNASHSLTNVIIWSNTATGSPNFQAGHTNRPVTRHTSHCLVQGALDGGTWPNDLGTDGGGNLDTDPLFVDLPTLDVRLGQGSPALGTGNGAQGVNIGYYQEAGATLLPFFGMYPDHELHLGLVQVAPYSEWKAFTLRGRQLPDTVTVEAPRNFEIAQDTAGGGQATLSLAIVDSTLAPTTLWVRFTPQDGIKSYEEPLVARARGFNNDTLWLTGTQVVPPVLTIEQAPDPFGKAGVGSVSSLEAMIFTGTALWHPVAFVVPESFILEHAQEQVAGGDTLWLEPSNNALHGAVLFVYFTPAEERAYADSIQIIYPGQAPLLVPVEGQGFVPRLTVDKDSLRLDTVIVTQTTGLASFVVSGADLLGRIEVNTQAPLSISKQPEGPFAKSFFLVPNTEDSVPPATFYVKAETTEPGSLESTVEVSTPGKVVPIAVRYEALQPTVAVSADTLVFGELPVGEVSPWQAYTVSAMHLLSPLTIEAAEGYVLSHDTLANASGSQRLALTPEGRTVAPTTLYVRFAPQRAKDFTAHVGHRSTQASTVRVVTVGHSPTPPVLGLIASSLRFGPVLQGQQATLPLQLNALHVANPITLTVPQGFGLSANGGLSYTDSLVIHQTGTISQNLLLRFAPTAVASYQGQLTLYTAWRYGQIEQQVEVSGQGYAPLAADPLANVSTCQDTKELLLPLTMRGGRQAGDYVVQASSSNGQLVPPSGLEVIGGGTQRQLRVRPTAGAHGQATITVLVIDDDVAVGDTVSLSFSLEVAPAPAFTLQVSAQPLCPGNATGGLLVIPALPGSYRYALNGAPAVDSPGFEGLAPGIYTIEVEEVATGCVAHDTLVLAAASTLAIDSVVVQGASGGQANGTLTLLASGGTGTLGYSLNGGAFASNATFGNLAAGQYTLTVRDGSGCQLSTTVSVGVATGLGPHQAGARALVLQPNPAHGQVRLHAPGIAPGEAAVIKVVDATGRCIWQARQQGGQEGLALLLATHQWKAGLYHVQVQGQNTLYTARLVLQ